MKTLFTLLFIILLASCDNSSFSEGYEIGMRDCRQYFEKDGVSKTYYEWTNIPVSINDTTIILESKDKRNFYVWYFCAVNDTVNIKLKAWVK